MTFTQIAEITAETGRARTAISIIHLLLDEYDKGILEYSMEQLAIAVGGTVSNISNVCNRLNEGDVLNIQYRAPDGSVSDIPRRRSGAKPFISLSAAVLALYRRT